MSFLCDTNIISELARPLPNPGVIAATAEIHKITLFTRNTKDFEGCGITILNPFT